MLTENREFNEIYEQYKNLILNLYYSRLCRVKWLKAT